MKYTYTQRIDENERWIIFNKYKKEFRKIIKQKIRDFNKKMKRNKYKN